MDDLISRVALKNAIATARTNYNTCPDYNELFKYFSDVVSAMIDELPAVDAEPVRHGKWIKKIGCVKCSICFEDCWADSAPSYEFCPNCGAKMDMEKEELE